MTLRHLGFYAAVAIGVAIGAAMLLFDANIALVSGINAFFLAYLAVTALILHKLSAEFLHRHAADEDAPAPFILFVMLAAVGVAAVSLFIVLSAGGEPLRLVLAALSVVLGWFAVHTMWSMHYAYEFYQAPEKGAGRNKVRGGLDFPGGEPPDGTAFLYFSYVIGMTAQTSDTEVTTNPMRRLVTVHSVFSFFFNTVIIAAAVNIAVALAR